MDKHYVVVNEWATQDEISSVDIAAVKHSYDEALSVFNELVAKDRKNDEENGYDVVEESEGYYCAFKNGEYNENHNVWLISEVNQ